MKGNSKNKFIGTLADTRKWGLSEEELLDKLIKIDYQTMQGLNEAHEGNTGQWAPLWAEHPDTWRLLVEKPKKIMGYWHFVALSDAYFELAKQGNLLDCNISLDNTLHLKSPGKYKGYFVSFAISAPYRNAGNLRALADSFVNHLAELADRKIYIKELCANALTNDGISLSKKLGMEHIGSHSDKGKIFYRKFLPLAENKGIIKYYPDFIRAYKKESFDLMQ